MHCVYPGQMGTSKRPKFDSLISCRSIQVLTTLLFFYFILVSFEIPLLLRAGLGFDSPGLQDSIFSHPTLTSNNLSTTGGNENDANVFRWPRDFHKVSGLIFDFNVTSKGDLYRVARDAFVAGRKVLGDLQSGKLTIQMKNNTAKDVEEPCPSSLTLSGEAFSRKNLMLIPCGLTLGSHITVVGMPKSAHKDTKISLSNWGRGNNKTVSEFVMELQGLKSVDGEAPPKILHFNPRIKGDWSGRPIIELNTCYRMQWGSGLRCDGWRSEADEERVDGMAKCEKWIRNDDSGSEAAKTTWWLKRIIGKTKKVTVDWPFPFVENKFFVLTLIAGLEGYHINVDGRHITSFPYRPGFTLEDATGFFINGDVDVHSVVAASLPTSHPNISPQKHLDLSNKWKSPNLPTGPVELFIGILSAGNHFAERMAVRKSWLQYPSVKSSNVIARFFVAMHARKEVNVELMKEAEFFGDIVMVPYMDNYDLVVLKTIAICEYGVRTVAAKYIMKCDDDTFVRIDVVMMEVNKILSSKSFYIGNINYYHRPLRHGKWAVTYEEWPESAYPPYANGPGYIISSDLAHYIISEFEKHRLRLFKMEDVSMGVWVKKFNSSRRVEYVQSYRFCQFGCIEGYYTAHYQSPRQMTCLWGKLLRLQRPYCCNMR